MTAWLDRLRELSETVGMDRYGADAAKRDRLFPLLVEAVAEAEAAFVPGRWSHVKVLRALADLRAAAEEQA